MSIIKYKNFNKTQQIMKRILFKVIRTIRKKRSTWSKQQDEVLINIVNSTQTKRWIAASNAIKTKTPFQCHQRYKLLNPKLKKGKWTSQEDEQLINLVAIIGKSWNLISKLIKNRSNKQIMNRYLEYLNDNLDMKDFTQAEDEQLMKYFPIYGKHWNRYLSFFPNRSARKIRRRYFLLQRASSRQQINRTFPSNNNNNNLSSTSYDLSSSVYVDESLSNFCNLTNESHEISSFKSFSSTLVEGDEI